MFAPRRFAVTRSPATLGEGFMPLVHAPHLGRGPGLSRFYVKDEALNPTNSFKARGQSTAVTRARALGRLYIGGADRR